MSRDTIAVVLLAVAGIAATAAGFTVSVTAGLGSLAGASFVGALLLGWQPTPPRGVRRGRGITDERIRP